MSRVELPRIPCDPTPECKYFEHPLGCHEDVHHVFRRSNEETCLERTYSQELGKVATCRAFHEWIEHEEDAGPGPMPFPPDDVMRAELLEAEVFISKTKRRKIFGND
jgi:hypothetical protein